MLTITTKVIDGPGGRAQVRATGHGRQRTVNLDHSRSDEQNRADAAGTLLNVLATPEQQAKVRHPSGGQRVRVKPLSDGGGRHYRWSIDV